ncbi:MAG TPA: hypothetical protein VG758_02150 [Hyphomicrobiaceae bacterium]|jgi:hypothetical protein|nr:hypothetical protein [Hyphomicrobiaceae bacterium]
MSLARTLAKLLSGVTSQKARAMRPGERQSLSDELRRVYRIIEGDRIVDEARKATAPEASDKRERAAFFDELRDGRGRE